MSAYESEKKELLQWVSGHLDLIDEQRRQRPIRGLDGNADLRAQEKQIWGEYKRRLKELREKYNSPKNE